MVRACANTCVYTVYILCFKYSAYSIYYVGTLETVCKPTHHYGADIVTHSQEANKLQGPL